MVSLLVSGPSCHRFNSQRSPKNCSEEKIVDAADVNLRLEYVDQIHLVLASGKLVLLKNHMTANYLPDGFGAQWY